MPKPIINFDDFLKDVKDLDAVAFMQKWGIEKNTGKQILDGLWLDQLMSFTNKTENEVLEMIIELAKSKDNETFDIPDKELFKAGHHNGKTYTESDIEEIVKNTNLLIKKDDLKIPLKLGHDNDKTLSEAFKQMLDSDSMPAFGFVENIKKVGDKIVGDYKNIPKQLYNLIDKGLFPKKSAEIWLNYTDNDGKKIGKALCAIALLGAAQPAIPGLYNKNSEKDVIEEKGEQTMPGTNTLTEEQIRENLKKEQEAEAKRQADEQARKEELAKKDEAVTKAKEEADNAKKELEEYKATAKKEKIEAKVNALVEKGAILPYQKNALAAVFGKIEDGAEKIKFSKTDGKEEEISVSAAFEELLTNRPKIDFTKTYSQHTETDNVDYTDAEKEAMAIHRAAGKTEEEIKTMFAKH